MDASPVGLGAVLFQEDPEDPENKKIIIFWSQLLSAVEQRYKFYLLNKLFKHKLFNCSFLIESLPLN